MSLDRSLFLLRKPRNPHRLKNAKRAQRIAVGGVFRAVKTHCHMALGTEVVNLIGLHLLDDPDQVGTVSYRRNGGLASLSWGS